jgi:hypothetical protein
MFLKCYEAMYKKKWKCILYTVYTIHRQLRYVFGDIITTGTTGPEKTGTCRRTSSVAWHTRFSYTTGRAGSELPTGDSAFPRTASWRVVKKPLLLLHLRVVCLLISAPPTLNEFFFGESLIKSFDSKSLSVLNKEVFQTAQKLLSIQKLKKRDNM